MSNSNQKKLLVLVSAFAKNKKDSGDFTYDLSSRLNSNYRVSVLAPHEKGLYLREKINGLDVRRFIYFYPIKYQKLAYGGGIPYNIKNSLLAKIQVPLFFIAELLATIKFIKKEKPDAIQTHWLLPQGLVGAICQKYYLIPHVATIHSSEVTIIKKMPFGRIISEFILINSKQIVSVSRHRYDELKTFISERVAQEIESKISFIPMGIDINEFKFQNKKKLLEKYNINSNPTILFVGRLVEVKGCAYLINAFCKIQKKLNNSQLIIIGNGPLEKELKNLTNKLDISQKVKFMGFIDRNEIPDYYKLADIVVVPSIIDKTGYQEGLPVVILEALASSKIIIASDIKGIKEIIKDGFNGFLVKPNDVQGLAQKILLVLKKRKISKIKLNALESVKKYDWGSISKEYLKIIKNTTN